jgi:hypothetical protein
MAGDWIKMGKDLLTHPKVVRMSSALRADRLRTVGGLFAVWCLFDTHSADGQLSGYTPEALDELVGFPGISSAMESVGWLSHDEEGVVLPRFEEHNGQSAKRRAQETDRKREERKTSAPDADKKRTREEKRREEEIQTAEPSPPASDGFETYWSEWPSGGRKGGKAECLKVWRKEKLEAQASAIVSHVQALKTSREWLKDGGEFIPAPVVYLRGKRWDGAEVGATGTRNSAWAGAL